MLSFIADVHVGNFQKFGGPVRAGLNDRARAVLRSLARAIELSNERGCEATIVLGDLFHYALVEAALISAVQEVLSQGRVILIPGNHDVVSNEYGNNALAPLAPVARVVEQPTVLTFSDTELWLVPFEPGPAKDWLPRALEKLAEGCAAHHPRRALGLHLGISDDGTPYYLDGAAASISASALGKLCKKHGVGFVFSGDWHRHQAWTRSGVEIMQVGALCPNRFPPNYEHGDRGPAAFWDGKRTTIADIAGPRFYKRRWTDGSVPDWPPEPTGAAQKYLKLNVRPPDLDDAKAWLSAQDLDGHDIEVDRGVERAKARTASFEARQASSLDDAVQLYVQNMPLDQDVSRDSVLRHVRQLIGQQG